MGIQLSLARAPALQAGGQEFDSPYLHQLDKISSKQYIEKYIDNAKKLIGKTSILEIVCNN